MKTIIAKNVSIRIMPLHAGGTIYLTPIAHVFPFEYQGIKLFAHKWGTGGRVSEMTSGMYIAASLQAGRATAIAAAKADVDRIGVAKAKRIIRRMVKQFGPANYEIKVRTAKG